MQRNHKAGGCACKSTRGPLTLDVSWNQMRWTRVTIRDMSQLRLPNVCANCLQSPADTLTPIVRSVGGPFIGAITTHGQWPLCERCSEWTTRPARWSTRFAIIPAGMLAALALLLALFRPQPPAFINPTSMWLLLASLLVAMFGCLFATSTHWWSPRPDSCVSNFPTVRPMRGGTALLSGNSFAVLEFLNPLYVEALLAENDSDNLRWKERRLKKAKASFMKRFAKPASQA